MSTTQVVMGAALGVLVGHGVLHSLKRLVAILQQSGPSAPLARLRTAAWFGALVNYAGVIATAVAVALLALWSMREYSSPAGSPAAASAAPELALDIPDPQEEVIAADPLTAGAGTDDPYADPEFKVQRRPHRIGSPVTLKEALIARSEAKARADLLKETQEHVQRSQYDCEMAERANRYLKSGLDVWAFTSWQLKYFPVSSYKGASLQRCKTIKDLVDPARVVQQRGMNDNSNS